MARGIGPGQRATVATLLEYRDLSNRDIGRLAHVSEWTVRNIQRNLHAFGQPLNPYRRHGPQPVLHPDAMEALMEYLLEKPNLYGDEMAEWLWQHFEIQVTGCFVLRKLAALGWTRKKVSL